MTLIGVGLALVVLVTFWPVVNNSFINYDDPDYVTANKHVEQGLSWQSLRWAFGSTSETANWHPVTWLSHMLDFQVFGANPRGHHFTSVLLHSLNAALLFLLLNRMTCQKWRSLAVAAFFGLHPLRVESVAWVAERKDVLCVFFFMLTLLAYARYAKTSTLETHPAPGWTRPKALNSVWYWLALAFFALGLMSKSMLVTLPFVLLLLDYWPLQRCEVRGTNGGGGPASASSSLQPLAFVPGRCSMYLPLVLEKAPFIALALASGVITFLVQKRGGAFERSHVFIERLENAIISYCRYLGKLFWPAGLSIHYPYPDRWPWAAVVLAVALLAGISLMVVLLRRRHPYLLVGWLWYVGMLVPVIGIVQAGIQSMADRYSYLPSVGLLVMLVWGISDLLKVTGAEGRAPPPTLGPRHSSPPLPRLPPRFAGLATIGALVACLLLTERQIGFWKDSGTLFRHAVEVTRNNNVALMHLGNYLREQGRLNESIEVYRQALAIDPTMEEPQVNLGVILYVGGQHEQGIQQLQQGLKVLPNSVLLHGNLGFFLAQQGQLDEATRHLQTALKLKPDSAEAHLGLGDICLKKGDREKAVEHFRQALKLRPDYTAAQKRLSSIEAH